MWGGTEFTCAATESLIPWVGKKFPGVISILGNSCRNSKFHILGGKLFTGVTGDSGDPSQELELSQ